jgi:hypothetical protein
MITEKTDVRTLFLVRTDFFAIDRHRTSDTHEVGSHQSIVCVTREPTRRSYEPSSIMCQTSMRYARQVRQYSDGNEDQETEVEKSDEAGWSVEWPKLAFDEDLRDSALLLRDSRVHYRSATREVRSESKGRKPRS